MRFVWMSDTGLKRDQNEDAVLVDIDQAIMILADGMGGHHAGEIASSIAAQETYKYLQARLDYTESDQMEKLLEDAVLRAHDCLRRRICPGRGFEDMGTTLLTAVMQQGSVYISNIGDSRAYVLSKSLKQITTDHAVEDGFMSFILMTDEMSPSRSYRVLTQAVGASETIRPDFFTESLQRGDILLLCSDGLTDMLNNAMIETIVMENRCDLNRTASELISRANRKGGYDNISVALLEML